MRYNVLVYSNNKSIRKFFIDEFNEEFNIITIAYFKAILLKYPKLRIIDILVLDGESRPGGIALCREFKNMFIKIPYTILLLGRDDDKWLAKWSNADAYIYYPLRYDDIYNKLSTFNLIKK